MYKQGYFHNSTVYIIDYNLDNLNSISSLVRSIGYNYNLFKTIDDFLKIYTNNIFGCILINLHSSTIDISSIPKYLFKSGCWLPVIGVLNKVNIEKIVNAIRNGVSDILVNPINKNVLEKVINNSFIVAQKKHKKLVEYRAVVDSFNSLTNREKQIFNLIIEGLANKAIANKLQISVRTVEMHRYHIMKKMQSNSVVVLMKQSVILSNSATAYTEHYQ